MKTRIINCLRISFALLMLWATGCQPSEQNPRAVFPNEVEIRKTAREYFETFAERADWDKLCAFYREDLKFSDILLQIELDSLWKFKRFYKWDEEGDRFKKLFPEQKHLSLESLVVEDRVAVARGCINPFYYDGRLIDTDWGMAFTIWLYFDDQLKIERQIDWMEYDDFTLEAMIKRCREQGHEILPDWLDLSQK